MSEKISVGQLQRNNAAYAVDDFRKMVNYESGTNKGYVRNLRAAVSGIQSQILMKEFNQ